jgi:hypothetical protein
MRRTDISDGLLFKSESLVGEERKWDEPILLENNNQN